MIYLIKSGDYVKIGFTSHLAQRLKSLGQSSPDLEVLDCKDGDKADEKLLHTMLAQHKVKNEWFVYNKDVKKVWNEYVSDSKEGDNGFRKRYIFSKEDAETALHISKKLNHNFKSLSEQAHHLFFHLICIAEFDKMRIIIEPHTIESIGFECGLTKKQVSFFLKELKEKELIKIKDDIIFFSSEIRWRGTRRGRSIYKVWGKINLHDL